MKKNTIIAFDGPDNVGKGTQIALLRKAYPEIPFALINLDRPVGSTPEEKISYGTKTMLSQLEAMSAIHQRNVPQIIDRMHYTEYAYSILRGGHDIETILDIEKKYADLQNSFLTIIFIDTVENIAARDDGLSVYDKDDHENIKTITDRFLEISQKSMFKNEVINIHGKDIPTVQQEVMRIIEQHFPDIKKTP